MTRTFIRFFAIAGSVEWSLEGDADETRARFPDLPWEEIDSFGDMAGWAVWKTPDGKTFLDITMEGRRN